MDFIAAHAGMLAIMFAVGLGITAFSFVMAIGSMPYDAPPLVQAGWLTGLTLTILAGLPLALLVLRLAIRWLVR